VRNLAPLTLFGVLCLLDSQQGEGQQATQAQSISAISPLHDLEPWRGPSWAEGGPWADQQPYTPRPKPPSWIDPEPSRWPWNGERDPYDYAHAGAVVAERCWGDYVCTADDPAAVASWVASHEPQLRSQSSAATKLAALTAQERCAEGPVDVTATSSDERRLACSAATHALQLLAQCHRWRWCTVEQASPLANFAS
jgi:hypothetical protein